MKTTKIYQGTLNTYNVRKLHQFMREAKTTFDFKLIANKEFAYSLYCDDYNYRAIIDALNYDMRRKAYKTLVK